MHALRMRSPWRNASNLPTLAWLGAIWIRMRRDLSREVALVHWPGDVKVTPQPLSKPEAFHALLRAAFGVERRQPAFAVWWNGLRHDSEFDPALCHAVQDAQGQLVAVAHGWTSGFIKDLAVAKAWRRTGVGAALVRTVLLSFQRRGIQEASLKVERDNGAARRLYLREGFEEAGESAHG